MNKPLLLTDLPSVNPEKQYHLERYVKFINSRPIRNTNKERGFNVHRVYPRSMAEKNEVSDFDGDWNLIKLTHREHFIAHKLLSLSGYASMITSFKLFRASSGIVV